jgi:hypothetical protein
MTSQQQASGSEQSPNWDALIDDLQAKAHHAQTFLDSDADDPATTRAAHRLLSASSALRSALTEFSDEWSRYVAENADATVAQSAARSDNHADRLGAANNPHLATSERVALALTDPDPKVRVAAIAHASPTDLDAVLAATPLDDLTAHGIARHPSATSAHLLTLLERLHGRDHDVLTLTATHPNRTPEVDAAVATAIESDPDAVTGFLTKLDLLPYHSSAQRPDWGPHTQRAIYQRLLDLNAPDGQACALAKMAHSTLIDDILDAGIDAHSRATRQSPHITEQQLHRLVDLDPATVAGTGTVPASLTDRMVRQAATTADTQVPHWLLRLTANNKAEFTEATIRWMTERARSEPLPGRDWIEATAMACLRAEAPVEVALVFLSWEPGLSVGLTVAESASMTGTHSSVLDIYMRSSSKRVRNNTYSNVVRRLMTTRIDASRDTLSADVRRRLAASRYLEDQPWTGTELLMCDEDPTVRAEWVRNDISPLADAVAGSRDPDPQVRVAATKRALPTDVLAVLVEDPDPKVRAAASRALVRAATQTV